MFSIDSKDIKRLESELKVFANKAFPFATKATLNGAAFKAQAFARDDIRRNLITRNKFTRQSIQVEQARTLNVRRQSSTIGSTVPYMEDQEFGGVKVSKGKEGTPIATGDAAGQRGSRNRTKLPTDVNRLRAIQISKRKGKGKNRKHSNVLAIKRAAAGEGSRYVFLDLGRRKGIFKVSGGPKFNRIRMIHDMTSKTVDIPARPWLSPAFDKAIVLLPVLYRDALVFQLKRRGLFRGGKLL